MKKINFNFDNTKYIVKSSNKFDKDLKRISKQGKDLEKLIYIVEKLAKDEPLDAVYRNHKLNDDGEYKDSYDLHIESDWILIYKYIDDNLILTLSRTGSHSDLF